MNILPQLSLNAHHQTTKTMSIVDANGIRLTKDCNALEVDNLLIDKDDIGSTIENSKPNNTITESIIYILSCNKELIIFINYTYTLSTNTANVCKVFRYKEESDTDSHTELIINDYKYNGGKLTGTFTYNVDNDLIIAISEYGENLHIPLKVINVDKIVNQTIDDTKISICPEVKIPTIENINYIKGNAYKGWYYFFIRYKIDKTDYTQWYNFGQPIYVDTINNNSIIKYCHYKNIIWVEENNNTNEDVLTDNDIIKKLSDENKGLCNGCSDYISNNLNIANESIKFDININEDKYNKYQIAFIVANKTYNKAFSSNDINISEREFELNISNCIECGINDIINDYYNYYNVHKVINYNNRLYIGNYEEDNANDSSLQNIANNITAKLVSENFPVEGTISCDTAIIDSNKHNGNQYDFICDFEHNVYLYPFTKYYNVSYDTIIEFRSNIGTNIKKYKAGEIYFRQRNTPNILEEIAIINESIYFPINADQTIRIYDDLYKTDDGQYRDIDTINSNDKPIVNIPLFYNNPKYSFNDRKLSCTLIPNEIYSFYIHFVDKYGHATNGYKLQNNKRIYNHIVGDKTITIKETNSFIISPIIVTYNEENYTYFGVFYLTDKTINLENIDIAEYRIYENNGIQYLNILDKTIDSAKAAFDKLKEKYATFSNKDFNWSQILDTKPIEAGGEYEFDVYVNRNKDKLFKVPAVKNEVYQILNIYPKFSNIIIPNGYVGYYISYERFEPCRRTTGMLTKSDFRNQTKIGDIDLDTSNIKNSDKMYYFTDDYDIDESIKLDYNMMILDGLNVWDSKDINHKYLCQSPIYYKYPHDLNKAHLYSFGGSLTKKYSIDNYKLVVANSSIDNRIGLGTALELDDKQNLFIDNGTGNESLNRIYRCSFYNYSKDIYTKTDKELIRIGDIQYNNNDYTIKTGLNGHYTFSGFLVYNNDTVIFDSAINEAKRIDTNKKYYYVSTINNGNYKDYYPANIPFVAYVQLLICDTKFHESKHFNNEPKGIVYQVKAATENDTAKFARGCFVEPINTIDLFKNKQTSSDEFYPKISTNYKSELANKIHYTKTIRRSNVIQDESKSIAWRRFPIEAYKNISENKGIITNIIGTGTSLIVHTEHSLFVFDVNNLLSTVDNTIQLTQPDSFEVAYHEVFSSVLGYGGLKDENAFILGEYGYIWFDSGNLFRYDYKSSNRGRSEPALALLDTDIKEYIDRNNITDIRFGEDKANNRLLIKFKEPYIENGTTHYRIKCISYNCISKSFISFHTYNKYDYTIYNTKNNIYFADVRGNNVKSFNLNTHGDLNKVNIAVIVNDSYNTIKYLNSIRYRFTEQDIVANSNSPVEEISLTPYSGLTIRAFSNETDTETLNVLIPYIPYGTAHNSFMNYTKPYYDRGNWNFNYLFNKKHNANTRIYGNYIIIDFDIKTANDTNTKNVIIEDVNFNISAI